MKAVASIYVDISHGDKVVWRKALIRSLPDKREIGFVSRVDIKNDIVSIMTNERGFIWQGGIKNFLETWEIMK